MRHVVHQRGRLEAAALTRANSDPKVVVQNQHIFSMFLAAVEASLSISLSQLCGAIRVGHLTWILPAEGDHQLLSLRAQMTSQGTLALLPPVYPSLPKPTAQISFSLLRAPLPLSPLKSTNLMEMTAHQHIKLAEKPLCVSDAAQNMKVGKCLRRKSWNNQIYHTTSLG
jgi:hypothetical protein